MTQHGIAENIAKRLTEHFNRERIFEKLDFLAYLLECDAEKIKSPLGWLRRAIEEDYGPPDGYKSANEQEAEAIEEQRREEERKRLEAESAHHFQAEQARKAEEESYRRAAEVERLAKLYALYGTTAEEQSIWQQVLTELEMKLSQAMFQGHLADSALFTLREGQAIVGLKNHFTRDWVANRLADKIQRALIKHVGEASILLTFVSFQQAEAERETA